MSGEWGLELCADGEGVCGPEGAGADGGGDAGCEFWVAFFYGGWGRDWVKGELLICLLGGIGLYGRDVGDCGVLRAVLGDGFAESEDVRSKRLVNSIGALERSLDTSHEMMMVSEHR